MRQQRKILPPFLATLGAAILLSLGVAPAPELEAAGSLKYQDWLNDLSSRLPHSSVIMSIVDEENANNDRAHVAEMQSPYTLRSSIQGSLTALQSDLTGIEAQQQSNLLLSNQLIYTDRSSLQVTLELDFGASSLTLPTLFSLPPYTPSQEETWYYDVKVGYDLIRGGPDGLGWTQTKAQRFTFDKSRFTSEDQILQQKIGFMRGATDLYVSQCKVRQLMSARQTIDDLVKSGRIQLKAHTLAYKDFLNFTSLQSQFAARIIAEKLATQTTIEAFAQYGPEFVTLATKIIGAQLTCDAELDRASPNMQDSETDRLAKMLPSYLAAEADTKSADANTRVAHLQNKPSLSPFVSLGFAHEDAANTNPAGYPPYLSAGVSLEWNIPGPRGAASEEAAHVEQMASGQRAHAAYTQNVSRLSLLQVQIPSQKESLEVLRESRKNSEELVRVLEAHRAIGSVDSLNFTTAFINNIDAQNAMLDSWGALTKSVYELEEYRNWAKHVQAYIPSQE
jgi:hypothetical protein